MFYDVPKIHSRIGHATFQETVPSISAHMANFGYMPAAADSAALNCSFSLASFSRISLQLNAWPSKVTQLRPLCWIVKELVDTLPVSAVAGREILSKK